MMPSKLTDRNRKRPWRARVREGGVSQFLGYYATQEEAEEVEAKFRQGKVRAQNGKI